MNMHEDIITMGQKARSASYQLAQLNSEQKNQILLAMADSLDKARNIIKQANAKDLEAGRLSHLAPALLDRLELNDDRITAMIDGFKQVIKLPDPVGHLLNEIHKDNGLIIKKVRVPIGVIGIIYESRPNVTADVAALCLKTGNAVILRGGKESIHSNQAIADALKNAATLSPLPDNAIQLIATTDRDAVKSLVQMDKYLDLVIPRGGEGLINAVVEMARVPVIKHYKGLCHTYVDKAADLSKAIAICENAKCQRPGVCNAMETLLIHQEIAPSFLPEVNNRMQQHQVECRGDEKARSIVPSLIPALDEDWDTEYLDKILSIKVVDNIEQAMNHINTHGSHHSDAIITEDKQAQIQFTQNIDSATVYINASTRFTDGAEFGMGAEIGISTDKLHARGPMGLEELTTYKYIIEGNGQVR